MGLLEEQGFSQASSEDLCESVLSAGGLAAGFWRG